MKLRLIWTARGKGFGENVKWDLNELRRKKRGLGETSGVRWILATVVVWWPNFKSFPFHNFLSKTMTHPLHLKISKITI